MAHPDETLEAVDSAFDNLNDAAAAFPGEEEQQEEAPQEAAPEQLPEGEEPEVEEVAEAEEVEATEEAGEEQEAVPIDMPVSWAKEAEEEWSQVPPAVQAIVAERETQREKFVGSKSQEAAEARKVASAAEENQLLLRQTLAQQLAVVANKYAPVPPPRELAQTDAFAYNEQLALYNANKMDHDQLMQQAGSIESEVTQLSQQLETQALQEDANRVRDDLPELSDQSAYMALAQNLAPVAKELGYSDEMIASARPSDVLAMKRANAWKEKADKYDALQSNRMKNVRAGKKAAKPNATQPQGSAKARAKKAAFSRLGKSGSLSDAAQALPDFI